MPIIKLFLLLGLSILSLQSMGQDGDDQTCNITNTYFNGECRLVRQNPSLTEELILHCYPTGSSIDLGKFGTTLENFKATQKEIQFNLDRTSSGFEICSVTASCLRNGTWTETSSGSKVYICNPAVTKK